MFLRVLSLLLLLGLLATAQNPQPALPDSVEGIQYPNGDIKDVLALYEKLTGKRLVYDNSVQGPVNIVVKGPLPRTEAIKIIEINLLLNGFSLVPEDADIVKVVGLQKNPRTAAVPIYSDLELLPPGERVVTFLFKLQYADPTELQQVFFGQQYVAPSTYTNVVALPKAQALLVTESTGVIRGLAAIIKEVDVPPAQVVSEFIKLERADAKDVIEKLQTIFEKPPTGPGGQPTFARPPNPAQAGQSQTQPQQASISIDNPSAGLSEQSVIIGKITLTADIRTNRIHVITRQINLPFVRRLIGDFDSDVPFGEPAKRVLKFVPAGDVLDIVVKAITEPGTKPGDATATAPGALPGRTAPSAASASGFGGSSSSSGGINVQEELSTQPVDTTPKAVTVGNTKIISDPRENTIIVIGNKQVQQRVFDLLDQIDVRPPQVLLNTIIGELTLNDDQEFGVDYLLRSPASSVLSTTGSAASNLFNLRNGNIIAGSQGTSLGAAAASAAGIATTGGGANALIGATNSLDIIVHALDATGRFHITNKPVVFASNNKKAIIASGQEIAVPTQTLSNIVNGGNNNNNAAVSSSVEFKRVALKLEVVPLINSDREVSLDILQELDSVVPGADRNVGGSAVPTISTRYIKTNLSVANRATVVLGGLITRTVGNTTTGIPLISRIPLLGYLFKNTVKKSDRAELIVLIRPVVTTSPFETVETSKVEQRSLLVEPTLDATIENTAAFPKATPGLVPFRYQK